MPSPIAHSITGYAISRLWSDRINPRHKVSSPWLLFYGVFIGIMADFDFIPQIITGDRYHHRFSHSITFAVGTAIVAWGIATFCRYAKAGQIGLLTLAVYGSHLILDLVTQGSSGIQLLWPFSTKLYRSSVVIFPSTYWSEPLFQHSGHFIFIAFELGYGALVMLSLWFAKITRKQLRG